VDESGYINSFHPALSEAGGEIQQQMTGTEMTRIKATGTYIITALYFLFGLFLSFAVPAFGGFYAVLYGDDWRPEQDPLIAPFFWPSPVWALCFGVCAFLLCLTARLPPQTRRRINIGAWIVFCVLVLHALDWMYGFIFCHEWGCTHLLPTWKLLI
jgi:uncharacterized BrkB/YihY/UPF0761 family membrane protein